MIANKLKEMKMMSNVNPQPEKGYRRISNEIFTALIDTDLTGSEFTLMLVIIDRSWGYKKKSAQLTIENIKKFSSLSEKTIKRCMKKLVNRNIILAEQNSKYPNLYELAITKYHDLWDKNNGQVCHFSQTNMGKSVDKSVPPTLFKENNNKENNNKEKDDFSKIVKKWNDINISFQKSITHSLSEKIKYTLSQISEDKLKIAIKNYGKIYHDNKYFYNHVFNLEKFLHSGNINTDKGYWQFLPEAEPFTRFLRKGYVDSYFSEIRKTHPFPKIGVTQAQRTQGTSNGVYMGCDIDFLKNDPYERFQLVIEPYLSKGIPELNVIHLENIIVMLIYQKKDEDFLRKVVDLHLECLEKYGLSKEV